MPITYLESPSTDPRFNLALEQYVFDTLPRDRSYLMLWQNDNAIIVGKHQNTMAEINLPYVQEQGIRVVRRLSGGGAVYHDLGNINYTFIVDEGGEGGLDFQRFLRPVVHALAQLGVTAQASGRNDITIDGQKCSGNAQYRRQGRVMHHGTILFDTDLTRVASALKVAPDKIASKGVASVRSRVTNVKAHLDSAITLKTFWSALRQHLVQEAPMTDDTLTPADLAAVEQLRERRYATWAWNYGRSPKYSIRKARRVEGCGQMEVSMEVAGGIITAFETFGDYFSGDEGDQVAQALVGCQAESTALLAALAGVDVGLCFRGLTAHQLVELILQ